MARSGHNARARVCASAGGTRSRIDGRGGTGLPDTMSAIAIVDLRAGLGPHDHAAGAPRRAHPEDVGHRRPAAGSGLAAEHPPDDHALPDDVGAEQVPAGGALRIAGLGGSGHSGILGWR